MPRELRAAFDESTPPAALERWLDAGPPPIFCGFGSLPVLEPASLLAAARELTRELGVRVVIGAGWSKLDGVELPAEGSEHLFLVGSVDHEWLFPRCAAAVHHGGIGTVNASLGAGLATMICSVWLDQPFWGERITQLGVGHSVPFAKLTAKRLVDGVKRITADETRRRARELGEVVAREDGTRAAADACERLLPRALVPE
jgi:sterol 3beta-glucosyltransferase